MDVSWHHGRDRSRAGFDRGGLEVISKPVWAKSRGARRDDFMGFPARGPKAVLGFEMTSRAQPVRKEWFLSTPVSRMATTLPFPVKPTVHAANACTSGALSGSIGAASGSSSTWVIKLPRLFKM